MSPIYDAIDYAQHKRERQHYFHAEGRERPSMSIHLLTHLADQQHRETNGTGMEAVSWWPLGSQLCWTETATSQPNKWASGGVSPLLRPCRYAAYKKTRMTEIWEGGTTAAKSGLTAHDCSREHDMFEHHLLRLKVLQRLPCCCATGILQFWGTDATVQMWG